jgi:hypothetical protein
LKGGEVRYFSSFRCFVGIRKSEKKKKKRERRLEGGEVFPIIALFYFDVNHFIL